MTLTRRACCALALAGLCAALMPPSALAQERVGILMLHGKSPGNPNDPNFSPLKTRFEGEGWLVRLPDMPWSRTRYLDGNWDQAMQEIAGHVRALRERALRASCSWATAWACLPPWAMRFVAATCRRWCCWRPDMYRCCTTPCRACRPFMTAS